MGISSTKSANNSGTATLAPRTISVHATLTFEVTVTNSSGMSTTRTTTPREELSAETDGGQITTPKPSNSTAPGLSVSATEVSPCDSVNTTMTGTNPDIESGPLDGLLRNATTVCGTTSKPLLTTAQAQPASTESSQLILVPMLPVLTTPPTPTEPPLVQVLM